MSSIEPPVASNLVVSCSMCQELRPINLFDWDGTSTFVCDICLNEVDDALQGLDAIEAQLRG